MFFRVFFGLIFMSCISLQSKEVRPSQTHRVLQFENERVKVWKTIIMPHQPLKLHRHDCDRVVVGLKGGDLIKIEQTGEKSKLSFDAGSAYWLEKDPIGALHGDINQSEEPIEVMVIEIKPLGY